MQSLDAAGLSFGQQDVAGGRQGHRARAGQIRGKHVDRKTCGHLQFGALGLRNDAREVGRGRRVVRRIQLLQVDAMHATGGVVLPIGDSFRRTGRGRRRERGRTPAAGAPALTHRILVRAVLHLGEVLDQILAVFRLRYRDHHGGARHHARGRGQEAVKGCRVPGELGVLQRLRIAEVGVGCGLAADHTVEVGALRAAVVAGLGAVAQRALPAEQSLARRSVGTQGRRGANERGHRDGRIANHHLGTPCGRILGAIFSRI